MNPAVPSSDPSPSPLFVLGLDGLSHSLVRELFERNLLDSLKTFVNRGYTSSLRSVIPCVSNVAWTSFFTGVEPGQHGIFGFVDRNPDPFRLYLCDGGNRRAPALWETISERGMKSIVINVAGSSPPGDLKGLWVGGMMSQQNEQSVQPAELKGLMKDCDYRVDVDPGRVREDPAAYLESLKDAMMSRFRLTFKLLERERDWAYFHLNVTETDRLGHFFLRERKDFESPHRQSFFQFFDALNEMTEKLWSRLPRSVRRVVCSEHGMREVKHHIDLNGWLRDQGYLELRDSSDPGIEGMSERSRAYSLLPGRIYLNLRGREERGSVSPSEQQEVLQELQQELSTMQDPRNNNLPIEKIYFRDQIYEGDQLERAPDMVVLPAQDYDFQEITSPHVFSPSSPHQGAHSLDDAFLATDDERLEEARSITEVGMMLRSDFT